MWCPVSLSVPGPSLFPSASSQLQKLLLATSSPTTSSDALKDGATWSQTSLSSRSQRPCVKVDGTQDKKTPTLRSQSRPCTELHKHLTSVLPCPRVKACSPTPHPSPQLLSKENEEVGEDCPSPWPTPASPQDSLAQDTASPDSAQAPEEDVRAMVQLIRYMHTYCLPQRKLPQQAPEPVPQPRRSPSRQASPRSRHPPKAFWTEFSILRELLAQDILCDVSKPYRLAIPVYASLTPQSRPRPPKDSQASPTHSAMAEEVRITASPKSTGPRPSLRPLRLEVKRDLNKPARQKQEEDEEEEEEEEEEKEEEEEEWGRKRPGRGLPWTKLGRKMDSSVCPVRRSRRLNPELGPWLTFTDEALGALPSMCLATETHTLEEDLGSLTDSSHGQQLPQGSQIPILESPCESGCGDTDEDPSCPQPPSRGSLWFTREGGVNRASPLGAGSTFFKHSVLCVD